ncbi:hypothetical protein J6590_018744 [Homalodisca vitripennis]|nr:hypothetical protein J6590_018744 [Homalodisca vitripennis]
MNALQYIDDSINSSICPSGEEKESCCSEEQARASESAGPPHRSPRSLRFTLITFQTGMSMLPRSSDWSPVESHLVPFNVTDANSLDMVLG